MENRVIPISVLSLTNENGEITPIKFKYTDSREGYIAVKIDRIKLKERNRMSGNYMYLYRCISSIDELEKEYELRYELNTTKWYLFTK